jgi:CRISPR/Cas system-associated exonuclease Cas4 (RecB family)
MDELSLDWPRDLDHISASSLKMAVRCPEQWRNRYVLGKKLPPAAALIAGRADHGAIEFSMQQKIETHVDLPLQDVKDRFVFEFEDQIERTGGVKDIECRDKGEVLKGKEKKTQYLGELKRQGVNIVGEYHKLVSPHVQPSAVEEEFSIRVADLPVKVEGRIDLIAGPPDTPSDLAPVMIDRKRRGRASARPEPEWVIQAEIYQLARPLPHEWHISVTPSGKILLPTGGKDDLLTLPVGSRWKAELLLTQIVGEVGYYYRRYGPDTPWPARGKLHPWACGYCGYKPTCWAHST